MEDIKIWAASICAAALCGSVIKLAAPKCNAKRTLNIVLSAFFLCCVIMPFTTGKMEMDFSGLISSDGKPAFEADDAMTEGVDNQIKTLFKAELEKLLKHENIEYKNIEIIYKTNAEGGTAIDEIEVTTESKTVNAEYIQKFLAEKTGIGNIKVIAEES